jgi:hypothetical protein
MEERVVLKSLEDWELSPCLSEGWKEMEHRVHNPIKEAAEGLQVTL